MGLIQLANRGEFSFIWSRSHLRRWYKKLYFHLTKRYEQHVYQAGLDYYRPGTGIIDAGAFVGIHAISWAHHIDGAVIAFEPVQASFQALLKNKADHHLSDHQLQCHHVALGQQNQMCHMVDDTLRSHVVTNTDDSTEAIAMRSIDSFELDEVSVIKLDVEGYELEVLKGAEALIKRDHPVIIFEHKPGYNYRWLRQPNSNAGIEAFLHELGYQIEKLKCYDYVARMRKPVVR
ncbi:MAG: FkbM family methyltransferase [Coxiellaceae bacterium]|nr:FkbM family methyltransferase [Coxiellaceae bacterium]